MTDTTTTTAADLSGERVEVYWNLHRQVYSVRLLRTGRVVAHVPYIKLRGVTFSAQAAGRERVRRTGVKNVHAFVRGMVDMTTSYHGQTLGVTYNPYKYDSFVCWGNLSNTSERKPIFAAPAAVLNTLGGTIPAMTASRL